MRIVGTLLAAGLASAAWAYLPSEGMKLAPKYVQGQEIVYSGTIVESCIGVPGVSYEQPYDLEMTALVAAMDAKRNAEMACYTVVKMPNQDAVEEPKPMDGVATFHFDMMRVTPEGMATWMAGPMKGKAPMPMGTAQCPWEMSCFLQVPMEPVVKGMQWTVQMEGQPPVKCTAMGPETVDGELCMKVACMQQSPTWTVKNATQAAWQCESTVWVMMKKGMVYKVHKKQMMRDAGEESPNRCIKTTYTQATNIVYNGPELMDRTTDFEAALKAQIEWEKLATGKSDRSPRNQIGAVRHQLKFALDKPVASPYRAAMSEMMRVAEEAEKNVASSRPKLPPSMPHMVAVVGKKARHLAVKEMETGGMLTLRDFKGKCTVLVYCDPDSPLSCRALETVVKSSNGLKGAADVYAVCMKTDKASMDKLRMTVPGDYKICKSQTMDRSYGMIAMPHTIMIDKEGMLRANFLGYGPELGTSIAQQVEMHSAGKVEQIGNQPEKLIR
jgi:hypothetical protein